MENIDNYFSENSRLFTFAQGSRMSFADGSEGCQFVSAEASFCLMGG